MIIHDGDDEEGADVGCRAHEAVDLEYDDDGDNHEDYDVGGDSDDEEDADVCRPPLVLLLVS